jgi:hypothetical protein
MKCESVASKVMVKLYFSEERSWQSEEKTVMKRKAAAERKILSK